MNSAGELVPTKYASIEEFNEGLSKNAPVDNTMIIAVVENETHTLTAAFEAKKAELAKISADSSTPTSIRVNDALSCEELVIWSTGRRVESSSSAFRQK